jgi:nitrogen regulatory protein P-II 1
VEILKEVKAVIQPARLARVREAMRHVPGFPGMTVTTAEGCSAIENAPARETIRAELTDYSPKVRVEVVCADALAAPIVAAIHSATHTGQKGDGIVWVTDVVEMRRLRD